MAEEVLAVLWVSEIGAIFMHLAVEATQGPCSDIPLMNRSSSLLMKEGGQACWAHRAPVRLPPPRGMSTLASASRPAQPPVHRLQLERLLCVPLAKSYLFLKTLCHHHLIGSSFLVYPRSALPASPRGPHLSSRT